jgi:hypothetical protein
MYIARLLGITIEVLDLISRTTILTNYVAVRIEVERRLKADLAALEAKDSRRGESKKNPKTRALLTWGLLQIANAMGFNPGTRVLEMRAYAAGLSEQNTESYHKAAMNPLWKGSELRVKQDGELILLLMKDHSDKAEGLTGMLGFEDLFRKIKLIIHPTAKQKGRILYCPMRKIDGTLCKGSTTVVGAAVIAASIVLAANKPLPDWRDVLMADDGRNPATNERTRLQLRSAMLAADHQRLVDARDCAAVADALAAKEQTPLTKEEVDALDDDSEDWEVMYGEDAPEGEVEGKKPHRAARKNKKKAANESSDGSDSERPPARKRAARRKKAGAAKRQRAKSNSGGEEEAEEEEWEGDDGEEDAEEEEWEGEESGEEEEEEDEEEEGDFEGEGEEPYQQQTANAKKTRTARPRWNLAAKKPKKAVSKKAPQPPKKMAARATERHDANPQKRRSTADMGRGGKRAAVGAAAAAAAAAAARVRQKIIAARRTLMSKKKRRQLAGGNSLPLVPHGMCNLNHICYLNAMLQALLSVKAFCDFLSQLEAKSMSDLTVVLERLVGVIESDGEKTERLRADLIEDKWKSFEILNALRTVYEEQVIADDPDVFNILEAERVFADKIFNQRGPTWDNWQQDSSELLAPLVRLVC